MVIFMDRMSRSSLGGAVGFGDESQHLHLRPWWSEGTGDWSSRGARDPQEKENKYLRV